MAFGAFVCKDCATLHRALDPSISTFVVATSSIDWSPAAIKFMRDVGNKAHNEFWEKDIPSGISKPSPTSTLYVYLPSKTSDTCHTNHFASGRRRGNGC